MMTFDPIQWRSRENEGRWERNVCDRVNACHDIAYNLWDRQLAPETRDIRFGLSCERGFSHTLLDHLLPTAFHYKESIPIHCVHV